MKRTMLLTTTMVFIGIVATAAAQQSGVPPSSRPDGGIYVDVLNVSLLLLTAVFAILAIRGARWAYVMYIAVTLLYFPLRAGFQFAPRACDAAIDPALALRALNNFSHLAGFTVFFLATTVQLRANTWSRLAWAALATVALGGSHEIAQAVTGVGVCRLRDLTPDVAASLIGTAVLLVWNTVRRMWPSAATDVETKVASRGTVV